MKKLRLELDALVVETFHIATAGGGAGTVRANDRLDDADPVQKVTWPMDECEYGSIPPTCMSCGVEPCPMQSATECPSCLNSCGIKTCTCPADQQPFGHANAG